MFNSPFFGRILAAASFALCLALPLHAQIRLRPSVITPPADQAVAAGQPARFAVVAFGIPLDLKFQWQRQRAAGGDWADVSNGGGTSGATADTLAVGGVTPAMSGDRFRCLISNGVPPDAVTVVAVLTVASPPVITAQPASQSVLTGGTATFTVAGAGTAPLSYQWRKNSSLIEGANGTTLTLANVQPADEASYSVVVSNSAGTVTSNPATLAATAPDVAASIVAPPANQSVLAGGSVSFFVSAAGSAPLSYQWRRDGVALNGATAATLALTNVQSANAGSYTVVVSNRVGTVTSGAATLAITALDVPASIVTQPASQSLVVGGNAAFAVTTAGTAPLSFQWRKDGVAIAGATQSTLIVSNAQPADAGAYSVSVANSAGSATSNAAALTVALIPPTIISQPVASQTTATGVSAAFAVAASGTGPLTYQWRKDGAVVNGATNTSLFLNNLQVGDTGRYTAVVTNGAGSVTSSEAVLTVTPPGPAITVQPVGQSVSAGQSVTLTVAATGGGTPTYQWFRDGAAVAGATGTSFTVTNAQGGNVGSFHVTVTNAGGTVASAAARLTLGGGLLWASGPDNFGQLGTGNQAQRLTPIAVLRGVASVAAGDLYSFFVKGDGTMWAAGNNGWLQLGDGTNTQYNAPVQVQTGVSNVAAGFYHTLYIKTDGTLFSVGADDGGQLARVVDRTDSLPRQVVTGVIGVAAGARHTLFVKSDGTLWASGHNFYGQLGDGTTQQRLLPVQVATGVRSVAAGRDHSLFVKTDGTLWGMGANWASQLGEGSSGEPLPIQIASGVSQAAAGDLHTVFVKTDGTLWALGLNSEGQLGDGTILQRRSPVQVATGVRTVAARAEHTLFVKTDGTLWGMGSNLNGQLGDGTTTSRSSPVAVATGVTSIAAGAAHSLFVTSDGTAWSMGLNSDGQLGAGLPTQRNLPIQTATGVSSPIAGRDHSLLLKSDETLWAMGQNEWGQLGDGTNSLKSSPVLVASGVRAAAAGWSHSLFVKTDGTLWAMGHNGSGLLGDGSFQSRSSPIQVMSGVNSAAAGLSHSLFVKTDGTLWAVGANHFAQLGDGTTEHRYSPVQVATGVRSAIASEAHSLFLKTDGTVWGMGRNERGQLGDGTSTIRSRPVQVASGVAVLAGSGSMTAIIKTDGSLWTTGSITLGIGGTVAQYVQLTTGVSAVAVGDSHLLFLRPDRSLWAIGNNRFGQMGLVLPVVAGNPRASTFTSTPVLVASNVIAVDAAGDSTFFVQAGGAGTVPAITTQPVGGTFSSGAAVTLRVAATGGGPIDYRWRKDGIDVPGARTATLELPFVQSADAGAYTAVASNSAGVVTSASAALIVPGPPVVTRQPVTQSTRSGVGLTLTVAAAGSAPLQYQWRKDGIAVAGATNPVLAFGNVQVRDAGVYSAVITNALGSATTAGGLLAVSDPPMAATQPLGQTASTGETVTLTVVPAGTGPFLYQWTRDGVAIVGATGATLAIARAQAGDTGTYAVTITNAVGFITSNAVAVSVTELSARLVNISTRGLVPAGGSITPGFVISGPGTKQLLIRAIGPTLAQFGVGGVLADPRLDLINQDNGTVVASNDNWGGAAALSNAFAGAGAFPLAAGSLDAAVVANLAANRSGYTIRVTGNTAAATGIALVEVYDIDPAGSPARLANVSTLGFAGSAAQVLTPGFVIGGTTAKRLLIRAIGPGLAPFNVGGALADTQLQVLAAGQTVPVESNDNWGGTAALRAAFTQSGAFALADASRDAAVVVTLGPGGYTVLVSGVGNTTGSALVEVYDLDP